MATKGQRLLPKLMAAIHARDVAQVQAMLAAGADPNGTAGYNAKALWTAASIYDNETARNEITRILLEHGADPNDLGPYNFDNRPIFYAAYCGYETVVRLLLAAGGFPRDASGTPARNSDGSTLLSLAANSGMLWLAELALQEGCRADEIDKHGSTALHYAAIARDTAQDAPKKDTAAMIQLLLQNGALLEHQRPGDWGTALHWALQQGDAAAVNALAAAGANLEAKTDRTQLYPVHMGASNGRVEAMAAAIALGANLQATDLYGQTALHQAALRLVHPAHDATEMLRALRAHGMPYPRQPQTPLALVLPRLQNGHNWCETYSAAQWQALAVLLEMADLAEVQNARLPQDSTLLHAAARYGSVALTQALLDKGMPTDDLDKLGWTALHHAAAQGHGPVIQALLSGGANPKAMTPKKAKVYGKDFSSKQTALMLAQQCAQADAVTALGGH